tara:strand:- start:6924 stop:8735 length:1812 start_codon:yes stop_codon:yes gene_type:complete
MNLARRIFANNGILVRKCHTISGGEIIFNKLKEHRVTDVFLYSGGAIMPAVDAFYNKDIHYYINTHEQSLGHAATAYAKSSGKPGICMVTSGPGITNMITPITDANNDSTPLIVFSGNVPKKAMGTLAFQECPATEITKPVTKWSYCVQDVNELSDVIDEAFAVSTTGKKGAVHIDLPKCITTAKTTNSNLYTDFIYKHPDYSLGIDSDNLRKAMDLINNCEKRLIIAGQGCQDSYLKLREFAVRANIPVTTTIHGIGVFNEYHNLSLQFLGMHGNAAANFAVQNADLIINIGSRFDDRTTGNVEQYAPEAYKAYNEGRGGIIHVNINNDEINNNIKSHFNFNTTSDLFLDAVNSGIEKKNTTAWISQIKKWESSYPFVAKGTKNSYSKGEFNTQCALLAINTSLKNRKDFIITTGVGNHQMWAAQFIKFKTPKSFISSGSLGVMGAGLPYSIGVQIANRDKLVIDIDGDGSFNHTLSELKTISNYNLPIKIAIMNDGKMSMVRAWEKLFFNERYTATDLFKNPDYCQLAESFGIKGIRCDSYDTLYEKVAFFLNYPGPILCDFKVQSELCYPLVKPGNALDDMFLYQNNDSLDDIDVTQVPS